MTIALAKDVEEFLQEQVKAGVCADASELANDVLRSVREQQRKPFEATPALEAWLLEAADKPATPLTQGDFDGVRQRVRARTRTSLVSIHTSVLGVDFFIPASASAASSTCLDRSTSIYCLTNSWPTSCCCVESCTGIPTCPVA